MQASNTPGQKDDVTVNIDINSSNLGNNNDIYQQTSSILSEVASTEETELMQQVAPSPLIQCSLFNCSTATKVNVAKIVGMMLCIGATTVAFTGVALVFNWFDYKEDANNNMSNSTSTATPN